MEHYKTDEELLEMLSEVILGLKRLDNATPNRSREVAITNLETGGLWLEKLLKEQEQLEE
ncbi:hypothetical protein HW132_29730 [Brasilonema sp. CT11]|nr:hypothetical protein [Brasilonema sp. CT11]